MSKCLICDNYIDDINRSNTEFNNFSICKKCCKHIKYDDLKEIIAYDNVHYIDINILLKVINRLQTKIDYLENKINILEGISNGNNKNIS